MPTIKTYRKAGAFYIAWEEEWLLKNSLSENSQKLLCVRKLYKRFFPVS